MKQIFTNADKIHAAEVLSRLGLEGCFEGIICFETLNPTNGSSSYDEEFDAKGGLSLSQTSSTGVFDILNHFSQTNDGSDLPKTPVLCKPSEAAMEHALKIANIDPKTTVSILKPLQSMDLFW